MSSTDSVGRTTRFVYDVMNRLTQVTDPAGGVTRYAYDGNGNLLTVTDAKGQVTTFTYDALNRLASTTDPLGRTETFTYDGADNLITHVTAKGETISFAYDAANQLISKTLPGSQVTAYRYDSVGNLIEVTDPDSKLAMTYDGANRLTSVSTAGSSNQPAVTLSYTYDQNGNRLSLAGPGGKSFYSYDALNRLLELKSPVGADGRCDAVTLPGLVSSWPGEGNANDLVGANHGAVQNGVTFAPGKVGQAFSLDGVDDFVNIGDVSVLETSGAHTVDAWVRMLSAGTAGGVFTKYRDDTGEDGWSLAVRADGKVEAIVKRDGGGGFLITSPQTVNDGNFHHLAMTWNTAGGTLKLYVDGVLAAESMAISGAYSGNSRSVFIGRRTNVNDQLIAPFHGLIDEVHFYSRELSAGEVQASLCRETTSYAYDALGRRSSVTLPNGTQTSYTYDQASQLTNLLHKVMVTNAQINSFSYLYDTVGNRTQLTDRRGVQAYSYDVLNRLTQSTHPLVLPQTFSYDAVGNRTTSSSVYNAGNQLTEDAHFTYQYDANGNLTRKTLKANGNYTIYTYDAENRLTKVEQYVAGVTTPFSTASYRYDGLGRRIEKDVNGVIIRYIYDNEDIILEYDGTNTLKARYTHGPGIDEPLAMERGGVTYYYHADGLGSITELTDSTGASIQSYSYDAWGNIVDQTGTVENPYTYTAREYDAETGLYYYRARYYDPRTGRFLTQDPIGLAGGLNLYAYVGGNPTGWIDPFGRTRLEFNVKAGVLKVDPERSGSKPYQIQATSGSGRCLNDPDCAKKKDVGPIPPGVYTLSTSDISNPGVIRDLLRNTRGDWGDWRVPLIPNPETNVLDEKGEPRSGFFLHGGKFSGSAGCIDVGGGIFGNTDTDRLLNDLKADPDKKVPLTVR